MLNFLSPSCIDADTSFDKNRRQYLSGRLPGTPLVLVMALVLLLLSGCVTRPPQAMDNICSIFREKPAWYKASLAAQKRWGGPIHVPLAIMHQESRFRAKARPPMRYFLWIIPIGRGSSAYGYAQAQNAAWSDYEAEVGAFFNDRDDFADAIDFIQWYMDKSRSKNGTSKWDAYHQYLNYHEGHGGYSRGTYKNKPWLLGVAGKVDRRAKKYSAQYAACKESLDKGGFWRAIF